MFEIEINGKQVKAEVSFYTAYLYEAEFQRDLIKDFLGVQNNEATVEFDGDAVVKIDFTRIDWNASQRALWAAIKTANDKTPGFEKWMKQAKGVNMWLAREFLASEVSDCFFRAEIAGEEIEGQAQ